MLEALLDACLSRMDSPVTEQQTPASTKAGGAALATTRQ